MSIVESTLRPSSVADHFQKKMEVRMSHAIGRMTSLGVKLRGAYMIKVYVDNLDSGGIMKYVIM